ncbi:MAG: hypothetical protein U1F58_09145 [Burkholderiales bacterium]
MTTKADALAFASNPLADPVGGPALGAGAGALALIAAIGFPPYLFAAPAAVAHGAACGAASVRRPTAEADFQAVVRSAGLAPVGPALENDVRTARSGCAAAAGGESASDTMVEIDRVEFTPGCAYGDWDYRIVANWRVTRSSTGAAVVAAKTVCDVRTYREVEAWFGDPEAARAEVGKVVASLGRRMAAEMLSSERLSPCRMGLLKSGEVSLD